MAELLSYSGQQLQKPHIRTVYNNSYLQYKTWGIKHSTLKTATSITNCRKELENMKYQNPSQTEPITP